MLVITRKRDEAIVIGHGIEVRVLRIGRDGVRLGVTAPTSIPVHRTEIYNMVSSENRAAAEGLAAPVVLADWLQRQIAQAGR